MLEVDNKDTPWLVATVLVLLLLLVAMLGALFLLPGSPVPLLLGRLSDLLFAASSVQALWYVTRAAGLVAYLLLWLSTAWGLAVSSKIFDPVLNRFSTYDMHQFISLFALGFIAVHVVVLLADRYLPFSLAQVVVPFAAPYRPVWVGIGVIGLYLSLLVSVTFYIRRWIGYGTFRVIHYISLIAFAAAAVHGIMSGTDSPLWTTRLMYAGTTLTVVFLFVYRILMAWMNPKDANLRSPAQPR